MANNEIILYQADNLPERIEVRIEDETVWLSQQQMAELFQQTKQNISLHISNCFREGELDKQATVKESLTVQKEGSRNVKRKIEYYNLNMIISVGVTPRLQSTNSSRAITDSLLLTAGSFTIPAYLSLVL